MITEHQAKKLVKRHLKSYVKRLKLEAWTLEIEFQEISEKTMGQCDCEGKYKDAKLLFDLRHIDNEKQFVETLQHELVHCVLADLDMAKEVGIIGMSGTEIGMYTTAFHHAVERTTVHLQRIIFGDD